MTRNENGIWKPEEYAAYHKMVFRELFNFLNSHFPPENDPSWWLQFTKDMDAVSDTLKGGPLVYGMLTAFADYLDEEFKKRRENVG